MNWTTFTTDDGAKYITDGSTAILVEKPISGSVRAAQSNASFTTPAKPDRHPEFPGGIPILVICIILVGICMSVTWPIMFAIVPAF